MNIAMISGWHVHAKGYADEVHKIDGCVIKAVWDEDQKRGKEWADELGCSFIENYDALLADTSIDAVMINSPTNMHTDLIVKAAEAKKHIFTEKVLSLTVADAKKIEQTIKANNVVFTISFPHRCRKELLMAKKLTDKGLLGDITYARVRNAHDGSISNWLPSHFYDKVQCGGGAMIDLGAHPVYLLTWFLGLPSSVSTTFTKVTDHEVEDNAVGVMAYKNGSIAVAETAFTARNAKFSLELNGTKGSLLVLGNEISYACEETEGKWISVDELDDAPPSSISQWIESINTGKEPVFGLDVAIELTTVMEAFYKSHDSGRRVEI